MKRQVSKGEIFVKFCFVLLVSAIDTNQNNNNVKMFFVSFEMFLSLDPYQFWRILFCFVVYRDFVVHKVKDLMIKNSYFSSGFACVVCGLYNSYLICF